MYPPIPNTTTSNANTAIIIIPRDPPVTGGTACTVAVLPAGLLGGTGAPLAVGSPCGGACVLAAGGVGISLVPAKISSGSLLSGAGTAAGADAGVGVGAAAGAGGFVGCGTFFTSSSNIGLYVRLITLRFIFTHYTTFFLKCIIKKPFEIEGLFLLLKILSVIV
jgi:hypothetical protein